MGQEAGLEPAGTGAGGLHLSAFQRDNTSNGVDLAQCSDQTCVAIGRKVSADFVVSGTLTDLGNKLGL